MKFYLTVVFDEETQRLCYCEGDFWKTCSLRQINQLDCKKSLVSITPLEEQTEPADKGIRSIDSKLNDLTDSLRHLNSKFKL